MTDYAAPAPVEPIVQGIVTYPGGIGTQPFFDGKGVSAIVRGASAQGSFILTLDVGLPGNAGAVPALSPPLLPSDPDVRTSVTPLPDPILLSTGVAAAGVTYITSAVSGVGAFQVEAVFTNVALIPKDPLGGFLIVVWRGQGFQGAVP